MTPQNIPAYKTSDFIKLMIGVPWSNRACAFNSVDCWGLVVLYFRHVLGIEIHQTPGYESGADFMTCFSDDVLFWQRSAIPVTDGIFVAYLGEQPAHVGLIVDRMALHSRGEGGSVRMDSLLVIERAFTKLEFYSYAVD